MRRIARNLVASVACVMALTAATAMTAGASETPQTPTTGQPGSPLHTCQTFTVTPGNAASANGSPFNSSVTKVYAGNDPSASLTNSNSSAAVSQYDTACFRLTTH